MDLLFVIFCWLISLIAIGHGIHLTKEVHNKNKKRVNVIKPNFFNISSDSVMGWIFGAFVSIVLGLFLGLFFKALPWWLARSIHFGMGISFFILGLYVLLDYP